MSRFIQNLVNHRVSLKTNDGKYEGTVIEVFIDPVGLALVKVIAEDTQERLAGRWTFYDHEISSWKVLGKVPSKKGKTKQDDSSSRKQPVVPLVHTERTFVVDDNSDDDIENSWDRRDINVNLVEEDFINAIPEHTILDSCDDKFQRAIFEVKQEGIIGVTVEGRSVNRYGQIFVIGISTTNAIFLFDIYQLKEIAFHHGLKEILESSQIKKVLHDCRQASDALFHLYSVKLINVFDTQVADVLLFRNKAKRLPSVLPSLQKCLVDYLSLDKEKVYPAEIIRNSLKEDDSLWLHRPVIVTLIDAIIKNVRYLLPLYSLMMEKFLQELTNMVDHYLISLREANEQEFEFAKPSSDVPSFFAGLRRNGIVDMPYEHVSFSQRNALNCRKPTFKHENPKEPQSTISGTDLSENTEDLDAQKVCSATSLSSLTSPPRSSLQVKSPDHSSCSSHSESDETKTSVIETEKGPKTIVWPKFSLPSSLKKSESILPAGISLSVPKKAAATHKFNKSGGASLSDQWNAFQNR